MMTQKKLEMMKRKREQHASKPKLRLRRLAVVVDAVVAAAVAVKLAAAVKDAVLPVLLAAEAPVVEGDKPKPGYHWFVI